MPVETLNSPNIYSVESLNAQLKKLLEMSYTDVWVEGEVGSIASPPSGHTYFTLKDNSSVLKCVLFKHKKYLASCLPIEGERILIRGRVSMYTGRGEVQLICSYIEAAGEGELRRQFEALKTSLKAEGLFDEERKQTLPKYPKIIALITSLEGAVLHDMITTFARRYPLVKLRIYPTNVQGKIAKDTLLQALKLATIDAPDSIILARGGGSIEDLQVFNDEALARAIFVCPIPIISAIGHETDFVISDFVADMRAPTPTAAVTLCTPDIFELHEKLLQFDSKLDQLASNQIASKQQQLDITHQRLKHPNDWLLWQNNALQSWRLKLYLAQQSTLKSHQQSLEKFKSKLLFISPQNQLSNKHYVYQATSARLHNGVTQSINEAKIELGRLTAKLQALSPRQTLSRGYSILQKQDGLVVKNAAQTSEHEVLKATLSKGKLDVEVKPKQP